MNRYAKGANFERKIIREAIENGAILALRGAGSKSYGKIKVDVIILYSDTLELIQAKKGKQSYHKEKRIFNLATIPKRVKVIRKFIEVK